MALAAKLKKAKALGITFEEGYTPDEAKLDEMIEAKQALADQEKEEERIRKEAEKKAAEHAKKSQLILKDVDGDDVDQEDYFWPRLTEEKIKDASGKDIVLPATKETAPVFFNKICGYPVDREELIAEFVKVFPKKKGFLFYKKRDSEVYLIIVPLKYAKTISAANESRPGDFQRHALSFINEGSVNIDSLRSKLERVANHKSSISTEPIGE
jgi:hypothetical protein